MTDFPVMEDIRIGDVTVSSFMEFQKPSATAAEFFVPFDADRFERLRPRIPEGQFDLTEDRIILTFQTFVIRTPRHVMLVDTCCGRDKFLPEPMMHPTDAWESNLHAMGLTEADIDFVLCTHLHIDHTGWNTKLENGKWVPNFPNAKYVFSRGEYAYWEKLAKSGVERPRTSNGIWEMNCLPVVEAGQALLVDDGHVLDEYVSLIPSPGHTPNHVCVRIASGGQEALAIGDMMHSVVQCLAPDWSTRICWDPVVAAKSRTDILTKVSGSRTVILPMHFPCPTAGYVRSEDDGFAFDFL